MQKTKKSKIIFRPWNIVLIPVLISIVFLIKDITKDISESISHIPGQYQSLNERALYIFLALCFGAGALYVIARIINYRRSFRWPRAQARVVFSRIEVGDDDGFPFYEPFITYKYYTKGKEYDSSNIYIHSAGYWREKEKADRFLSRYKEGGTIDIYYNPSKPGMSFIERTAWGWYFWMKVFLLFLAVMFIFFSALSLEIIEL
jgi:hypothetical protein